MSTNYYLHVPTPWWKGGEPTVFHIGKSSAGWCFSLRVYPEAGIQDLVDWLPLWTRPENVIKDEYGETIPFRELFNTVTRRSWPRTDELTNDFLKLNHAVPGPNGLMRHKVDSVHCIGHGDGTWDRIAGEFS